MDKKTLIALGTGLALSLASITGCADTSKNMQAKEMSSGYKNKSVTAQGKCGASKSEKMDGKCGASKSEKMNGKCGASKSEKMDGKCGAEKSKKTEGKCGSGKCGANKK